MTRFVMEFIVSDNEELAQLEACIMLQKTLEKVRNGITRGLPKDENGNSIGYFKFDENEAVLHGRVESMADFPLKTLLKMIANSDPSQNSELPESQYLLRNRLVMQAVSEAQRLGLSAGLSVEVTNDPYPIVAWIELPTGYVGWHLPALPDRWDGSSTEEKYNRISKFSGRKP